MSSPDRPSNFEQFWPHYLRAHDKRSTRLLHHLGVAAAAGCLLAATTSRRRRWLLWVAPAAGYLPAWLSHLALQRNLPRSFAHPVWALRAGVRMTGLALTGGLAAELQAATQEPVAAATEHPQQGDNGRGEHADVESSAPVVGGEVVDPHSVN